MATNPAKPDEGATSTATTDIARLEKRIEELEAELRHRDEDRPRRRYRSDDDDRRDDDGRRRRRRRSYWDDDYDDTISDFRDVSERKGDELARVFRGFVRASLESFRTVADSASDAADDVLDWNTPERNESPADAARHLPADLTRGIVRAIDDSLDAPSRAIDTYNRTFRDPDERGRSRRRHRSRSSRRRESSRDSYDERYYDEQYEDWSTSELFDRAADVGVEGRAKMSRDELISAIREREARRHQTAETRR